MSLFLNNTSEVAKVQVRIYNVNTQEVHRDILNVVRSVVSGKPWVEAELEDINIAQLTGGLSNILYSVHHLETGSKVIVRVFGAGTSNFIDRTRENIIFSKLSKNNLGPIFYGLFENGRVEGFLEARSLEPPEMQSASIYPLIASSVCQLHYLDISEIYEDDEWLWRKTDQFFTLASNIHFERGSTKQHMLERINLNRIKEEFEWLKLQIKRIEATTRAQAARSHEVAVNNEDYFKNAGRLYGFDTVLCHNDLLSGNIMLSHDYDAAGWNFDVPTHERDTIALSHMTLIDYEYASYNFRGFDLANHFVEYTGVELTIPESFPEKQNRLCFLKAYMESAMRRQHDCRTHSVSQINTNDSFLSGLEEVVCLFLLQVHIFWGVWSIVQSGSATIDFDYLAYAELRNMAYAHQKKEFGHLFSEHAECGHLHVV